MKYLQGQIFVNTSGLQITLNNEKMTIEYKDIQETQISLHAYLYMVNILSVWYNFYCDITIKNLRNTYHFECRKEDQVIAFMEAMQNQQVKLQDELHLQEAYRLYPDIVARHKYYTRQLKQWEKENKIKIIK